VGQIRIPWNSPLRSYFNFHHGTPVPKWFCWTIDKETAHGEFTVVCREIVVFFVDDRLVGLRDLVWLQSALNILIILFKSIGCWTNSDKTKVMTCISGK
jgi:hypothetical protein